MDVFERTAKLAKDVYDSTEIKRAPRSIASEASKAVYYFPILCSKNVSANTASLAAENLESVYGSFMNSCFTMTPAMTVKGNVVRVEDYLKMFHQNIGINSNDDYFVSLREANEEWKMFPNDPLNEAIGDNINTILKRNYINNGEGQYSTRNVQVGTVKDKDTGEITPINAKRDFHSFNSKEIDRRNGIRPTILQVEMVFIINGKEIKTSVPVGIKAVIHPVEADDLVNQVTETLTGKNSVFHNIVRYTTGEVLSLKDILFGTTKMKKNISGKSSSSFWFDAIEHRKRLNKLSSGILGKKPFLPNITILMSMDDVYSVQGSYGFNLLTDTYRTMKFMRDNFLLAFAIADEATETMYILYDGSSTYEEYPYATLRRLGNRKDSAVDDVIKVLGIKNLTR